MPGTYLLSVYAYILVNRGIAMSLEYTYPNGEIQPTMSQHEHLVLDRSLRPDRQL